MKLVCWLPLLPSCARLVRTTTDTFVLSEEHWERDKHKFEGDFEGGREYRDEERRGYGGDEYGRRGGDTIVENETIVNDNSYYDRPGTDTYTRNETVVNDDGYGRQGYSETTVVRDDGYGDDGYRRDDSFVDDAARWTGNKVCSGVHSACQALSDA